MPSRSSRAALPTIHQKVEPLKSRQSWLRAHIAEINK
jgi:hypothetical protein